MYSFSLKLTDKRVDKILLKAGYKNATIFYSPIAAWLVGYALLLLAMLPVISVLFNLSNPIKLGIIIYLIIYYVIILSLNRSFAITEKELIVISTHPLFSGLKNYKLEDINEIKISSNNILKLISIPGFFGSNYVEIKTHNQQVKFYCLFLDLNCYDENWTEKTLDDLDTKLKSLGLKVEMLI